MTEHIGICAKIANMFALAGALWVVSLIYTTAVQIVSLAGRGDMSVTISNHQMMKNKLTTLNK